MSQIIIDGPKPLLDKVTWAFTVAYGYAATVPNPAHVEWAVLPATIPDPNDAAKQIANPAKGAEPPLTITNPETPHDWLGRRLLIYMAEVVKSADERARQAALETGDMANVPSRTATQAMLDSADPLVKVTIT